MKDYRLKKTLSSSVTFLTVLALILSVFIMPVFAAEIDERSTGYEEVDLGSPSKVFNDDNSVRVTYDLTTVPYSRVYGNPVGDDELYSLVAETTDIYFQQSLDDSILVFTTLVAFDGNGVNANGHFIVPGNVPKPDNIDLATTAIFNDVVYTPRICSFGRNTVMTNYGTAGQGVGWPTNNTQFLYNFASGGLDVYNTDYYSLRIGYYEDISLTHREYDSIYAHTWPLGKNGDYERIVDISDIRYGSDFDIALGLYYNIDIGGDATAPGLRYDVYFLDANYSVVSVEGAEFDLPIYGGTNQMSLNVDFTVPFGAEFFYIKLDTGHINVTECNLVDWRLSDIKLAVDMSDVEHDSQMMEQIKEKLDEIKDQQQETNDKLDEIISGTPGANAGADNMQDVAGDYKDHVNNQLQNGQAQMDKLDQLPRPDVSGAVTLPEWATSDQFLGFNAVVATVWENETIYEIMVVASILMLASYILFGKKV